ncbi:hypothetical protein F5Y05DRAFT_392569 [Hypoxylon sp. FL0543]|nr:hypothetical protein F5Y05DRAFT_392569 [Hypoxylon sp. FL0543]
MHPLTLIIAMSATVLALPHPLPATQALADTIMDGVNGILGVPNRHNAKCHYRNKDDFTTCINQCVDEFCLTDPAGCNSCIRGCTSKNVCDDANAKSTRKGTAQAQAAEASQ